MQPLNSLTSEVESLARLCQKHAGKFISWRQDEMELTCCETGVKKNFWVETRVKPRTVWTQFTWDSYTSHQNHKYVPSWTTSPHLLLRELWWKALLGPRKQGVVRRQRKWARFLISSLLSIFSMSQSFRLLILKYTNDIIPISVISILRDWNMLCQGHTGGAQIH